MRDAMHCCAGFPEGHSHGLASHVLSHPLMLDLFLSILALASGGFALELFSRHQAQTAETVTRQVEPLEKRG